MAEIIITSVFDVKQKNFLNFIFHNTSIEGTNSAYKRISAKKKKKAAEGWGKP